MPFRNLHETKIKAKIMNQKVKITYFDLGMNCMMAKIVMIYGWYDLQNQMNCHNIQENSVLKVEVMVEADTINTEDMTEAMQ